MTVLRSTLDLHSPDARAARECGAGRRRRHRHRTCWAVAGGGDQAIARHHKRGKLTARNIELLLDPDAPFLELAPLGGLWVSSFSVGGSVVAGIGVVEGVEAPIIANDPTVRGGASNPWSLKKTLRMHEIALQIGCR